MQTSSHHSQIFMSFILLHKFHKEENGAVKTDRIQKKKTHYTEMKTK